MKLVIFSDAHGYKEIVQRILDFNSDTDYFISLGDSELQLDFLVDNDIIPIKGNYPRDAGLVYEKDLVIEGKKIFLTHGHKYGVHRGLKKLAKYCISKNCDISLYGHTHIASLVNIGTVTFVNPGSCARSRNELPPTYLIIIIEEDKVTYTFKESLTNTTIEV
jgi:putative phosphoesterase